MINRPPLGRKDLAPRHRVLGVGTEPVDRFGGKCTSSPSRSACTAVSISTWVALTLEPWLRILPAMRVGIRLLVGSAGDSGRKLEQCQWRRAFGVVGSHQ